jgi:hypothetical protein
MNRLQKIQQKQLIKNVLIEKKNRNFDVIKRETMAYEMIELINIQEAIKYKTGHHFKSFIDAWYCYKHGYCTASERPNLHELKQKVNYLTKDASMKRKRQFNFKHTIGKKNVFLQQDEKVKLYRDLVIPITVLREMLFNLGYHVTPKQIEDFLKKYVRFCLITNEDRLLLSNNSIYQAMPSDWDGKDLLARYKNVNIPIIKNSFFKI